MERLQCKACGAFGLVPMDVEEIEIDDEVLAHEPDARFYSCHVCGDNWLAVRTQNEGRATVTFVHQMGLTPTLKRVAHLLPEAEQDRVERWEYFRDEDEIEEAEWQAHLTRRRETLRSICTN
ncbi:MAG: hypothetical protein AAFP18_17285 [Bacteroidota bacterium]